MSLDYKKYYLRIIELMLLFTILILGLVIRWQGIDTVPYSIEQDEYQWSITAFLNSYNINSSDKGAWTVNYELSQYYPVTFVFDRISFYIFGPDLVSPRKMLIVISTLSLLAFYLFIRRLFPAWTSLITLTLYSFSTYKLITSRIVEASAYIDLFTFVAAYILIAVPFVEGYEGFSLMFLGGLSVVLAMLTYNQGFLLPLVFFMIFVFKVFINRCSIKVVRFYFIAFFLPIIVALPRLIYIAHQEALSQNYALTSLAVSLNGIDLHKLYGNLQTVFIILFLHSSYDMIVNYSGPIVNTLVVVLALIGIVIGLLQIKRYYPILCFFIFMSVPYQLFFGINAPRWWYLSISVIYILAGVVLFNLERILKWLYIRKKRGFLYVLIILLFITISYIIQGEVCRYYYQALYNPSFRSTADREMFEITYKYRSDLGKNIAFIFYNDDWYERDLITNLAASSYNYVLANSNNANNIRNQSRLALNIMNLEEFYDYKQISKINKVVVPYVLYPKIRTYLLSKKYKIKTTYFGKNFDIIFD